MPQILVEEYSFCRDDKSHQPLYLYQKSEWEDFGSNPYDLPSLCHVTRRPPMIYESPPKIVTTIAQLPEVDWTNRRTLGRVTLLNVNVKETDSAELERLRGYATSLGETMAKRFIIWSGERSSNRKSDTTGEPGHRNSASNIEMHEIKQMKLEDVDRTMICTMGDTVLRSFTDDDIIAESPKLYERYVLQDVPIPIETASPNHPGTATAEGDTRLAADSVDRFPTGQHSSVKSSGSSSSPSESIESFADVKAILSDAERHPESDQKLVGPSDSSACNKHTADDRVVSAELLSFKEHDDYTVVVRANELP